LRRSSIDAAASGTVGEGRFTSPFAPPSARSEKLRRGSERMRRDQFKNWLFGDGGNGYVKIALLASYVFFLLILNRWLVTDLGMRSFGRVWQFYVSYSDLGFVRRALLGSFLSYTKLNTLIKNEYVFAHVFSAVCAATAYALTYLIMRRGAYTRAFVIAVAFSPAFLLHFGYANGSLDLPVLVVALTAIVLIDNLVCLWILIVVGILVHEVFVFLIPLILVLRWDAGGLAARDRWSRKNVLSLGSMAAVTILTYIILKLFGADHFDEKQFYQIMAQKMPTAAYQHGLWSGYYELFSTLSDNLVDVRAYFAENMKSFLGKLSLLTVVYALYLSYLSVRKNSELDGFAKLLVVGAALFPLLIMLIGTDFLRWTSFSGAAALLALIIFVKKKYVSLPPFHDCVMLAFCTLAPFGMVATDYPFPIILFIGNKILSLIAKFRPAPAQ
jgi:hypothetical protein